MVIYNNRFSHTDRSLAASIHHMNHIAWSSVFNRTSNYSVIVHDPLCKKDRCGLMYQLV